MAAILTFPSDHAVAPPDHRLHPSGSTRAPVEVYRRRRLAVAALVAGLVLGVFSWGRSADASRTPEAEAADAVTYVVQPGDTLWTIALGLGTADDPRPLVDALDEIAGGALLHPGQRLVVPGHLID